MLNVWIELPKCSDKIVSNPDMVFMDYLDYSVLETEYAQEIIRGISGVVKIYNYNLFKGEFGLITPLALSHGAKVLLLMLHKSVRDDGLILMYNFCGENCDKYLERIAVEYDVNLWLSRFYIPSDELFNHGVKFIESGRIVYTDDDFIDEYYKLDTSSYEQIEDDSADGMTDEEFLASLYSND